MDIQEQSAARQFLVQEDDKQRIADIFERIIEAREQLVVRISLPWVSSVLTGTL
jgi:hypothetical protein